MTPTRETEGIRAGAGMLYKCKHMIPAAKLLRCLKMINTLKRRRLSVEDIAFSFSIDKRTAYRYLRLFETVGYCVDKDFKGRYFIFGRLKLNCQCATQYEKIK